MRTSEERIRSLHNRARELKNKRDKALLAVSGSLSVLLLMVLGVMTWQFTGLSSGYSGSVYAASSLLDAGTGGYVLTAVLAFMAGVIIAVMIKNRRNASKKSEDDASL